MEAPAAEEAVEPEAPALLPPSEAPPAPAAMDVAEPAEGEWTDLVGRMRALRRQGVPAAPPAAPEPPAVPGSIVDDLARSWEDVFGECGAEAGPMIMAAHAPSAAEAPVHARWADLKDAEDDENAEQEAEQEAAEDIWVDEALDLWRTSSPEARANRSATRSASGACA